MHDLAGALDILEFDRRASGVVGQLAIHANSEVAAFRIIAINCHFCPRAGNLSHRLGPVGGECHLFVAIGKCEDIAFDRYCWNFDVQRGGNDLDCFGALLERVADQIGHDVAAFGFDGQAQFLGFCQEFRIFHHRHIGVAEFLNDVRVDPWGSCGQAPK